MLAATLLSRGGAVQPAPRDKGRKLVSLQPGDSYLGEEVMILKLRVAPSFRCRLTNADLGSGNMKGMTKQRR